MLHTFVAVLLLSQGTPSPTAQQIYVVDASYDRVSCESGERLKNQRIASGTQVTVSAVNGKVLKLVEAGSGREVCIKARQRDLIATQRIVMADGNPAEFLAGDNSIEPPQVAVAATQAPLSFSATDSPDLLLPDVILIYAVAADGSVKGCRALRSSRSGGWDNWAMALVCNSKYAPAKKNGVPIAVTIIRSVPVGGR